MCLNVFKRIVELNAQQLRHRRTGHERQIPTAQDAKLDHPRNVVHSQEDRLVHREAHTAAAAVASTTINDDFECVVITCDDRQGRRCGRKVRVTQRHRHIQATAVECNIKW